MTDLPKDKDGKLYENRKDRKLKMPFREQRKNGAKEAVRKQSRDSTDKLTTK
jgi:hypothetical protein